MSDHYTLNTVGKLTFIFLLFSGFGAGIAQETEKPPAELLSKAAQKTSQAQSYTIEQTKVTAKDMSKRDRPSMKNRMKGTIKFEKPYLFMKMSAEVDGKQNGAGSTVTSTSEQKIIGQVDSKSGKSMFYSKSALSGNKWENMNKLPLVSGSFFKMGETKKCIMCGSLSNPGNRFKNIYLAGSETINGKKCYKIIAKIRESAMNKKAQNMLKGPMKKMVSDFTMDVLSSRITYWIRKKSKLIEKVNSHMKQKIDLTVNLGGKEQTRSIQQISEEILNYTQYNRTNVPEKYKQKFNELHE